MVRYDIHLATRSKHIYPGKVAPKHNRDANISAASLLEGLQGDQVVDSSGPQEVSSGVVKSSVDSDDHIVLFLSFNFHLLLKLVIYPERLKWNVRRYLGNAKHLKRKKAIIKLSSMVVNVTTRTKPLIGFRRFSASLPTYEPLGQHVRLHPYHVSMGLSGNN